MSLFVGQLNREFIDFVKKFGALPGLKMKLRVTRNVSELTEPTSFPGLFPWTRLGLNEKDWTGLMVQHAVLQCSSQAIYILITNGLSDSLWIFLCRHKNGKRIEFRFIIVSGGLINYGFTWTDLWTIGNQTAIIATDFFLSSRETNHRLSSVTQYVLFIWRRPRASHMTLIERLTRI